MIDETLARWAKRDAAIGLDAELVEVRDRARRP